MGNEADLNNNQATPEMAEAQKQGKKDGSSTTEPAPAYVPATTEENSVLAGEDGEIIDYKTLTWWYVGPRFRLTSMVAGY